MSSVAMNPSNKPLVEDKNFISNRITSQELKLKRQEPQGIETEEAPTVSKILKGRKLFFAFIGMLMSIFLIALDQNILSPVMPVIASDFHSLDRISWIASSYFITQVSFLLLYAQLLTKFDRRCVLALAASIFELGSLICALAPDLISLIVARAIAGVGAAGIFVSCYSIIANITELEDRPRLIGSIGAVYAASSVIGPLLGGIFTDHLSWRWCFWFNLPFGAIAILSICFLLPNLPPTELPDSLHQISNLRWRRVTFGKWLPRHDSFMHTVGTLDFFGVFLISTVIILLVLPLQWGGNQYAWDSGVIIGTLIGFPGMLMLFLLWEWKGVNENNGSALLSFRILANRTQIGGCLLAFFNMLAMLTTVYFLPIHFQVVKRASATQSGIDLLPLLLAIVVFAALAGFVISATGYYWPALLLGPMFLTLGCGLLHTLDENSGNGQLIGFQIIVGLGIGLTIQNVNLAIQANVAERDVPQANGLMSFVELIGGLLGITIAQTIFNNALTIGLEKFAPDAPFQLVHSSVTSVNDLSDSMKPGVIRAYMYALQNVYIIGIASGSAGVMSALLIKNKNIKPTKEEADEKI